MSEIEKLRKKAGFTQRAFAEQVGVAEITVRKWEKGKRNPRLGFIRKMAKVLGCHPGRLI